VIVLLPAAQQHRLVQRGDAGAHVQPAWVRWVYHAAMLCCLPALERLGDGAVEKFLRQLPAAR
jgi:hypothetical protein